MKIADLAVLLTGVLLNAGAQLALKAATSGTGPISVTSSDLRSSALVLATAPAFWVAIAAYGLSVIVWVVGLSRVPVSQAYPLLSLGYVVNAIAAWWLLSETLNFSRIAGIAVIIVGVVIVARS
jgi:drug/metabolite transporter (DMT)-like permease